MSSGFAISSESTTSSSTVPSSSASSSGPLRSTIEHQASSSTSGLPSSTTAATNSTLSNNEPIALSSSDGINTSIVSSTALDTQITSALSSAAANSTTLETRSSSTSSTSSTMSSTTSVSRLESSTVPSRNNDTGAPAAPPNDSSTSTSTSTSPPTTTSATSGATSTSTSASTSVSTSPPSGTTSTSSASPSQTNTSANVGGTPNTAQTSPTIAAQQVNSASTTTSVVVVKGTTPSTTVVSTITDAPKSVLKSPIGGVLVTESNGQTSLSFPAFVTVLSTSQQADGSFVTYTHTMANPTGADVFDGGNKGFFQNHGAVAGVFLALGIVLASIAGCIFWMIRKRRKRQTSTHRWIEDMQRHPASTPGFTDDPFLDEPPMTAVDPRHRVALRSPDHFQLDDGPLIPLTPTYQTGGPGSVSNVQRKRPPTSEGPFSDANAMKPAPEGFDRSHVYNRPPSALQVSRQSTPSLYPPTDRDELEEVDLDDDPAPSQRFRQPISDSADTSRPGSTEVQPSQVAPPRPPRSILRTSSKTYEPYTPPPSDSNHSASESPITPISEKPFDRLQRSTAPRPLSKIEVDDIFTRPTLLNVRPRSRDDETTK